jgi:dTDP-4-amino-4,6-dideoxygalactose transaminase/acetyltransferase-like isoleucine patch superfamily enzyme
MTTTGARSAPQPAERTPGTVHGTAVVEEGAGIGEGTRVWHHAHVRSGAVLGRDCVLGKNVFVDAGAVVGDRCKIQNNVSVYTGVTLGSDVFVGPSAVFTNDLRPRASAEDWTVTPTVVRDGASIGANATVVCGTVLGEHCMVAAGSVVTRDVRPHQLVAGNPARPLGWVCTCGEVVGRDAEPPADLRCPRHRDAGRPAVPAPAPATAPAGAGPIPISVVSLGAEEEALVLEVLRSGRLAQGPKVEELEQRFAARHGVEHAVAVNNGTTALVAALQALEIGPGDEVVTSPLTFAATVNAVLETGATVRFADIGDDFCLDPDAAAALVGPRTRAVLPVHLYGLPADMPRFEQLARGTGVALVEDAAQAHGARVGGRPVGSSGLGCFSFYATKNVMCGEGGMVTTPDAGLADRLRLLRNQGMRARYQYEIPGHNYRLTDLQAAIALPQLARLDRINAARRANAAHLSEHLRELPGIVVPEVPAGREHVFHQYTVRITGQAPVDRDEFVVRLAERGVTCGVYYPRLAHDHPCYREHPGVVVDATPVAARVVREVVSLPVHPQLGPGDLARIVDAVGEVLR